MTLEVDDLEFRYRRSTKPAIARLSISFASNAIAVLGPNGAGKSTFFGLLSSSLRAQRGVISLHGRRLSSTRGSRAELRSTLGLVPQGLQIFPDYTCRQFLAYVGWLKKLDPRSSEQRVDEALGAVDLLHYADQPVKTLSGGMRQRLSLAGGLLGSPSVVLLDEPTVGLDPLQRSDFLGRLVELTERTSVVLATHLVEDVAVVADEVLVLNEGTVAFAGSLEAFCGCSRSSVTGSEVEDAYRRVLAQSQA